LLSPQRLSNQPEYANGSFFGTSKGLAIQVGNHQFFFSYEPCSFLPIEYASISPLSPISAHVSIHHDKNQNLASAQKLLLHWHDRFGHLNLPAV
jgi:hypothetical protein